MSDDTNPTQAGLPDPAALARLSMSLPAELLHHLDVMVDERDMPSRSQMIAQLIRRAIADHQAETRPDEMLAGTITLVYRGDLGNARQQLASKQREFLKEVISSQHVFLENDQSLEVLLVQGPANRLEDLCDALRSVRGVRQLQLVTTTSLLPPLHEQEPDDEQEAETASHRKGKAA